MKEYVYLIFYQHRELPDLHSFIEYRCKHKIDHIYCYEEMERWVVKKLQRDIIITGFSFLREESY